MPRELMKRGSSEFIVSAISEASHLLEALLGLVID